MKKLDICATLVEGCKIGLVNFFSLLAVTILYVLTIWIPYLNVGTTIAVLSLPAELAKGKMIDPLFIFESKYRRNMGEFFILYTLYSGGMVAGFLFGIIPGFVISVAWSLAFVLFVDKDLSSLNSLRESNRLTYGNKWRIFWITILFSILLCVVLGLLSLLLLPNITWLSVIAGILITVVCVLVCPVALGLDAAIYKSLLAFDEKKEEPKAAPVAKPAAPKAPKAEKPAEAPAKKSVAKKPAAKKAPAKKAPSKKVEK